MVERREALVMGDDISTSKEMPARSFVDWAKFHLRFKLKMNWTNDTRTISPSTLRQMLF